MGAQLTRKYRKNKATFHVSPPVGASPHLAHLPTGSSPQPHPHASDWGELGRPPGRPRTVRATQSGEGSGRGQGESNVEARSRVHGPFRHCKVRERPARESPGGGSASALWGVSTLYGEARVLSGG
jgi:hypothetical protein